MTTLLEKYGKLRLNSNFILVILSVNAVLFGITFVLDRKISTFFMLATLYQVVKFFIIRNKNKQSKITSK